MRRCFQYVLLFGILSYTETRCRLERCMKCSHGRCTECQYGWYGYDCSQRCVGCWTGGCEQDTGRCIQCAPGYYKDLCDVPCPKHCRGSYDGITRYCNRTTGQCLEGCEESYWGQRCENRCNDQCLKSSCEQMHGTCFHGCEDGWFGMQCHLRCSKNCDPDRCSYLYGQCEGCKHGFHGRTCNVSCHNCINDECSYNEIDQSLRCTHGCQDGWTSQNCGRKCSKWCRNNICNMDGTCKDCPEGYFGSDCRTETTNPAPQEDSTKNNFISKANRVAGSVATFLVIVWFKKVLFSI